MLGRIKNFTMQIMGAIPVLKNYVPKSQQQAKESKEKTRSERKIFHGQKEISEQGFSSPFQSKKDFQTSSLEDKSAEYILPILDKYHLKIFHNESDNRSIAKSIKNHIKRLDDNPHALINFNQNLIKTDLNQIQNHLTSNYQEKLKVLNQSKVDLNSVDKYLAINKQFLIENIRLSMETQKIITQKVLDSEIQGNKIDLAKAFAANQEISKALMKKTMEVYLSGINLLPSVTFSGKEGETHLRSFVNDNLKDFIRLVYLGSEFGIHNKELVFSFMNNLSDLNFGNDQKLYNSLLALTTFQNSIHGSVLQDASKLNQPGSEVAEIDEVITKRCLKELLNSIIKDFELKHNETSSPSKDKELKVLRYNIQNIQNFLSQIGRTELGCYVKARKASKTDIWSRLGFDSNREAHVIDLAYKGLNKTFFHLGKIVENNFNEAQYENSVLEILNDEQAFNKHFRRILFETKLLAGIDVISSFRGRKLDNNPLTEKNANFQTVPWLKDFYQESVSKFERLMATDKSVEGTMNAAKELSNLGHQLNRIGSFNSGNFFKRYGIEDLAEKMLTKMGDLTEIGVIAIMIDLYSNLFSYLDGKDGSSFMKPDEVSRLKRLVRFLKKIATITDNETGEVLFNPPRPNKDAIRTYDRMAGIIRSKGFLLAETDLILDFFKKAIEQEKIKKEDQGDHKLLDAKNAILATWLLYILVKFLPKKSDNIDSLKARIKVLKTIFNDNLQKNREIPSTLYPKITNHLMGYKPESSSDGNTRPGIITELCNEVENKIQDHINGKQCNISLKELLYAYQELEKIILQNPKGTNKALQERKRLFNENRPLLQGLDEVSAKALDADPALIVNFAKESKDSRVKLKVANELLDKISKLTSHFTKTKSSDLEVLDSDSTKIHELSKILIYSQYLGFLTSPNDTKQVVLRANNLVSEETDLNQYKDQIGTIDKKITELQELLSKNILLLKDSRFDDKEEAFKDQHKAKTTLVELLNKPSFKFRPSLGNKFDWLTEQKAQRLKENQAQYSLNA